MNKLDKIESEYNLANDKYQKTCIKLNEAMKSNIEKESEIDKLNLLIKDMNSDLTNSTSDSDVTNITNHNEYTLSITKNKDVFNTNKLSNEDQSGLKDDSINKHNISLDSTIVNKSLKYNLETNVSNSLRSTNANSNSLNSNSNSRHK